MKAVPELMPTSPNEELSADPVDEIDRAGLSLRSKYLCDRIIAAILLVLLSPFLLLLALAVRRDGGPALFTQARLGLNGRLFAIYKFRTMLVDADRYLDANGCPTRDRITGAGKWLRKTGLDELPQLLNILKGEMSFVGPRPTLPAHLELYDDEQRKRFLMKPGVTGLAQVNGRNQIRWSERLRLDAFYVDHYSWLLDLKIIAKTLGAVLWGRNVVMDRNPGQVNDLEPRPSCGTDRVSNNFETAVNALNDALVGSAELLKSRLSLDCADSVRGDDLFVIGNPRSGTTLTYQICAGYFGYGYFSNLAAITWSCPELGLMIAERFRHNSWPIALQSTFGRTADWNEPHEVGRVWERLIRAGNLRQPDQPMDISGAISALRSFRSITGRRMVYKGVLLTWCLAEFAHRYPNAKFVFVRRSLVDNALSLVRWYRSRAVENGFISLVSRSAQEFKDDPLPERAAAQVYFNDLWIRGQLEEIAPSRHYAFGFENLLTSPVSTLLSLAEFAESSTGPGQRKKIEEAIYSPSKEQTDTENDRERISRRLDELKNHFPYGRT